MTPTSSSRPAIEAGFRLRSRMGPPEANRRSSETKWPGNVSTSRATVSGGGPKLGSPTMITALPPASSNAPTASLSPVGDHRGSDRYIDESHR